MSGLRLASEEGGESWVGRGCLAGGSKTPPSCQTIALVRRKAIKQAIATGALQVVLTATAAGTARWMRRIPRFGGRALVEAGPVGMPHHRDALAALGPVAAGTVVTRGKRRSVGLRAGENVVHVRRISPTVDDSALLGKRGLLGEIVGAMQFGNVLRNDDALGVDPWPAPDAVAGIHVTRALRAQVSVPGLAAGTGGMRKRA